jgi:hypothetical protein
MKSDETSIVMGNGSALVDLSEFCVRGANAAWLESLNEERRRVSKRLFAREIYYQRLP